MDPAIAQIYMASTAVSGKYFESQYAFCPLILAILLKCLRDSLIT